MPLIVEIADVAIGSWRGGRKRTRLARPARCGGRDRGAVPFLKIRVVDRMVGFDEVPAAFAHLESGRHVGKVCIRIA